MAEAENKPTVSVIIPTYNRAHLVGRAIQSVLNQTNQDFEIIVVDDGSTDNTEEVVKGFGNERVRFIRLKENSEGSAAPRNTGIKVARGTYIAFLDSDDEWLAEKLEEQIKVFEKSDLRVGAVYTGLVSVDQTGETKKNKIPQYQGPILRELLASNCVGTASTVMVRRKCFEKIGGFDETMPSCQDWNMWIRLAGHYKFDYIPQPLVRYFEHGNRISTTPKVVIAGYKAIFKKFEAEIEKEGRQVKANHYFRLGNYLCHYEKMEEGRHNLLLAVLIYPWNGKYFLYFFASIFGERIYLKLTRIKQRSKQLFKFFS